VCIVKYDYLDNRTITRKKVRLIMDRVVGVKGEICRDVGDFM
jgi:hypothetical protein